MCLMPSLTSIAAIVRFIIGFKLKKETQFLATACRLSFHWHSKCIDIVIKTTPKIDLLKCVYDMSYLLKSGQNTWQSSK